ncbi:hypothetical protein QTH97_30650 [Variovorax sp. J22R24]|uniref:hypothetical protein n=1 Tax=Variovorax gracilis TaxID=3053502 RepID=UPI002578E6A9|nr:hypothetical protein [Variovorax sp. J22R24]MDM0109326.1 hypothetical protein [Variovorax sp. J22R24]
MKTDARQDTVQPDRRALRSLAIVVVVLVVGAMTYNFFTREEAQEAPAPQPSTQAPSSPSPAPGR